MKLKSQRSGLVFFKTKDFIERMYIEDPKEIKIQVIAKLFSRMALILYQTIIVERVLYITGVVAPVT